jgi:hypothetical protein
MRRCACGNGTSLINGGRERQGRHHRITALVWGGVALVTMGLTFRAPAHAGNISYAYDAVGRLTCVYDAVAGRGANYVYDAVGNLTSITTASGCAQNTMRILSKRIVVAKKSGRGSSAIDRLLIVC